jgi:hypothetical protein
MEGRRVHLYARDHPPLHVHVFRGRRLVARYDLEGRRFMPGSDPRQAARVLRALRSVGLVP